MTQLRYCNAIAMIVVSVQSAWDAIAAVDQTLGNVLRTKELSYKSLIAKTDRTD
jgi:hypothetical protein